MTGPMSDSPNAPTSSADREEEHRLVAARREKLEKLRAAGVEPYPYRFDPTHDIGVLREAYDPWDGARLRWWDGHQWTGYAATHPASSVQPTTPPRGIA